MKKITIILMAFFITLTSISCGTSKIEDTTQNQETTTDNSVSTTEKKDISELITICGQVTRIESDTIDIALVDCFNFGFTSQSITIICDNPTSVFTINDYYELTYSDCENKCHYQESKKLVENNKFIGDWIIPNSIEKLPTFAGDKTNLIVTSVFENCLFGLSEGNVYKIETTTKVKACVGDWIGLELEDLQCYDSMYYCAKYTGDHSQIIVPPIPKKPVIYLYPNIKTIVNVKLIFDGKLICTYPNYVDGWTVLANPDGTLTDSNGFEYNYLYWEGVSNKSYSVNTGYCIKGEDTVKFLENTLETLGLNRKEANEFIVYWLPLMQNNRYNVISFDTNKYLDSAKLDVTPTPDTIIRVFMTWYSSDNYVNVAPETYTTQQRGGFTVVEWGGCEIN